MKVSLERLYSTQQSLQKLLAQDLPVNTAFRLSRLAKQIKSEMDTLEENRVKLVNKYGTKEKDESTKDGGEVIRVTKKNFDKFAAELKALLTVEIEIDFDPISASELGDLRLSALDLANLDLFVCE